MIWVVTHLCATATVGGARTVELARGTSVQVPPGWTVQAFAPSRWLFQHLDANQVENARLQVDLEEETSHAQAVKVVAFAEIRDHTCG